MPDDKVKQKPQLTQYDLRDLINRCLDECKMNGAILGEEGTGSLRIDERSVVVDHISKTIIGELLEFEILRKLAPLYRQEALIKNDLAVLEDRATTEWNRANLRVQDGD